MSTPTTAPGGTSRIPALDTLRAVGALAVLLTHVGFHSGAYDAGVQGRLVARMDVGVAIFFVLSGFLLSRPWLAAARDGRTAPPTRTYLRRRFWRIYPAYAVVSVGVLLLQPDDRATGPGTWLATLTMTGTFGTEQLPYGYTQTWSLGTEVCFYLLLPLLARAVIGSRGLRPGRVLLGLGVLVGLNVAWVAVGSAALQPLSSHTTEWLPGYLTWFAVGLGLALVEVAPDRLPRVAATLRHWGALPGSCLVVVLALLLVAGTPLAGPTGFEPATVGQALTKNLAYAAVGGVLLVPVVWGAPGSRFVAVLSHPWARRLGQVSFSLFLVHVLVIELVMAATGFPLFGGNFFTLLGLTLAISLPASALLHRYVEVPALELGSRGERRSDSSTVRTIATTDAWPVQASSPAQPESPPQGRNA